jgi:hypothetical protein
VREKGLSLKLFLQNSFGLDLRSLALFRILFGFCIVIDITYRIPFAYDFYSDWGVLPREALISQFMNVWESSLFLANGKTAVVAVLMFFTVLSATAFMLGFYTRVTAALTWLLVVSLQIRNPVVLHGGDDLIRVLLFWCQFVPLGAYYSVDGYLNKISLPKNTVLVSFGGAGLLLQFLYMYFFTGILKLHPVWHTEGTGIYYALSLDQFSTSIGKMLTTFPILTQIMTYITLVMEILGPLFILAPVLWLRPRFIIALLFIGFHFGLFLTMNLGLFPWVCMAAWSMVLPQTFWERIRGHTFSPIVYVSNLLQRFKVSAPSPRLFYGKMMNGVAAIYIVLVTAWNIYQIDDLKLKIPHELKIVMSVSEMYQRWSMFAPYPRKDDGWYLIEATSFKGKKFDPTREDLTIQYTKPENMAETYKNSMWRKYLTNIWLKNYYKYRVYFGRYLCRTWNMQQAEQENKIDTVYIYYMLEMTPLPGTEEPEAQKELLWRHYCYDKPADWKDQ